MATSVKTSTMQMPYSLGKILPGGTSASVPLTQNILPVMEDGTTPDKEFNEIRIQAAPTNGAALYVCNSAAAPDTVAFTNIIAFIAAGATFTLSKEWANNRDLSKLFLGAANGTDFAIASINAF